MHEEPIYKNGISRAGKALGNIQQPPKREEESEGTKSRSRSPAHRRGRAWEAGEHPRVPFRPGMP